MGSASVLKRNTSQAVWLPKLVALPESVKPVDIITSDRVRLIVLEGEGWDSWFDGGGTTDDFMIQRDQPDEGR